MTILIVQLPSYYLPLRQWHRGYNIHDCGWKLFILFEHWPPPIAELCRPVLTLYTCQ
jgi:hypothetical protein